MVMASVSCALIGSHVLVQPVQSSQCSVQPLPPCTPTLRWLLLTYVHGTQPALHRHLYGPDPQNGRCHPYNLILQVRNPRFGGDVIDTGHSAHPSPMASVVLAA